MDSFYKPPKPTPRAPDPGPTFTPPRGPIRGDRTMVQRMEGEPIPDHRIPAETLEGRGKIGLTNARVLNRAPQGCLFVVKGTQGFFDLQGYWCVKKANREVEVRRGAPRKINRLLTDAQRRELAKARLNARRQGLR